jgi:hypothetical protein
MIGGFAEYDAYAPLSIVDELALLMKQSRVRYRYEVHRSATGKLEWASHDTGITHLIALIWFVLVGTWRSTSRSFVQPLPVPSGCEGRISVVKRRHGLSRCRHKTEVGMQR